MTRDIAEEPAEEVDVNRAKALAIVSMAMMLGCHQSRKGEVVLDHQQIEDATAGLRQAYVAFNRGDIDAAVRILDPDVEWVEPPEFPGGGTYHGVEGAKHYLAQSRASAAQVISEPEQFIPAGNRIVVFVHARVLPNGSNTWQEVRLADVYTFKNGRATNMRAFANRDDALRWVGATALSK
jgi:ketosteroid isomerase-like protein